MAGCSDSDQLRRRPIPATPRSSRLFQQRAIPAGDVPTADYPSNKLCRRRSVPATGCSDSGQVRRQSVSAASVLMAAVVPAMGILTVAYPGCTPQPQTIPETLRSGGGYSDGGLFRRRTVPATGCSGDGLSGYTPQQQTIPETLRSGGGPFQRFQSGPYQRFRRRLCFFSRRSCPARARAARRCVRRNV